MLRRGFGPAMAAPMDPSPVAKNASIAIYVDADACPVKPEIFKVAERHRLRVFVVANSFMMLPREPWIERVVVRNLRPSMTASELPPMPGT